MESKPIRNNTKLAIHRETFTIEDYSSSYIKKLQEDLKQPIKNKYTIVQTYTASLDEICLQLNQIRKNHSENLERLKALKFIV